MFARTSSTLLRATTTVLPQRCIAAVAARSFTVSTPLCQSKLTVVSSPDAPKAIGPYSQAIKANGFVFISGCLGIEPKSGEIRGDVVQQTKQAMENMRAVLKASGSSFSQVVKTTILLADIKDFPDVNAEYKTYFESNPPARSTFAVKDLPKAGLVEIEAIAVHN